MPGAMEDNKWELKYGQIAILERHTLGLGLKRIKKNKREREGESIEEDVEQNMSMDAGENEEAVIWKQRKNKKKRETKNLKSSQTLLDQYNQNNQI